MKKALLLLFLISFTLKAEYRVYQYNVSSSNPYSEDKNSYLVTSTLNPRSYIAYHGGGELLKVDLLRTWMCKGYTGQGKPLCPAPLDKMLQEKNETPKTN